MPYLLLLLLSLTNLLLNLKIIIIKKSKVHKAERQDLSISNIFISPISNLSLAMWYLHWASAFVSQFGREKDNIAKRLIPVQLPNGCDLAPKELPELIAYGCKSDYPCKKGNFSTKKQYLSCSIFYVCKHSCRNPLGNNYEKDERVDSEGQ